MSGAKGLTVKRRRWSGKEIGACHPHRVAIKKSSSKIRWTGGERLWLTPLKAKTAFSIEGNAHRRKRATRDLVCKQEKMRCCSGDSKTVSGESSVAVLREKRKCLIGEKITEDLTSGGACYWNKPSQEIGEAEKKSP